MPGSDTVWNLQIREDGKSCKGKIVKDCKGKIMIKCISDSGQVANKTPIYIYIYIYIDR